MAIKKSELYSSLWKSCNELRGGMDSKLKLYHTADEVFTIRWNLI